MGYRPFVTNSFHLRCKTWFSGWFDAFESHVYEEYDEQSFCSYQFHWLEPQLIFLYPSDHSGLQKESCPPIPV